MGLFFHLRYLRNVKNDTACGGLRLWRVRPPWTVWSWAAGCRGLDTGILRFAALLKKENLRSLPCMHITSCAAPKASILPAKALRPRRQRTSGYRRRASRRVLTILSLWDSGVWYGLSSTQYSSSIMTPARRGRRRACGDSGTQPRPRKGPCVRNRYVWNVPPHSGGARWVPRRTRKTPPSPAC